MLALRAGLASLLVAAVVGCGGGGGMQTDSRPASGPSHHPAPKAGEESLPRPALRTARPERYRPGDPDCRPRQAPGTVGSIGEDVAGGGARVRDLVRCYGPPVREVAERTGRCLYYRQRGTRYFWELCARQGRIVSGAGSQRLPRER